MFFQAIQRFHVEHGIQQTSTPYTPQQNGVIEHFNKTIVKLTHSMIHKRNINAKYGVEAINTILYLKTRSLHKALIIWHQKKLGVKRNPRCPISDFLGTHVMLWSHPKQEQKNTKYMSIGYSENSKTYLLINCASRKIKIRHDVIFDEGAKMTGFESNMSQDNEKIIGAMEVNRNAILYNLLKDNIKITYVGNIQQSAPNFNLHLEKMDTLNHGGHNDNI